MKFKTGSICGTDMHFYRGEWNEMKRGQIIGYNACGARADTGERVIMMSNAYCGFCYYCLRGLPTYCSWGKLMGLTRNEFFAEKIALRTRNLISVPEKVSEKGDGVVEPIALGDSRT